MALRYVKKAVSGRSDIVITSEDIAYLGGGGGGSGLIIENGGAALPSEPALNFDGVTIVASNNPGVAINVVLGNTAVMPNTYGDATHVGAFTVDQQGRITGASAVAITGTFTTLPQAYANGAAGPQVVTEDAVRLGVLFDAAGTIPQSQQIFGVVDSSFSDPAGETPFRYLTIFPRPTGAASGGGLRGWDTTFQRQVISIYGGDTTPGSGSFDTLIRIEPPLATGSSTPGNLILRAQDGPNPIIATEQGGALVLVPGQGSGGVGGGNGDVILGGPGSENGPRVIPYLDTGDPFVAGGPFHIATGTGGFLLHTGGGDQASGTIAGRFGIDCAASGHATGLSYEEVRSASLNQVWNLDDQQNIYTVWGPDALAPAYILTTHVAWSAEPLAQWFSGTQLRAQTGSGAPSFAGVATISAYGNLGTDATVMQFSAIAAAGDAGFRGAGYMMDATPVGGMKAFLATGGSVGNTGLLNRLALYNTSYQGAYVDLANGAFNSLAVALATGGTPDIGSTAVPWRKIVGTVFQGLPQTFVNNGVLVFDTSIGETITLTANGNITSLSLTNGVTGQQLTFVLIQDAGGASSWPNTISNAKLVGGVFTKTTSASAVDVLHFRCLGANAWVQDAAEAINVH